MNELASITTEELGLLLEELHEPKFRTSQVMKWLAKGVPPKEMLNIPKTLREKLSAFPFGGVGIIECKQSKKDDTAKMLYETEDGNVVELHCTADLESGNGKPIDGRKVRGTIHWVSAKHAIDAELNLYDNLFTLENTAAVPEGKTYLDFLNPESRKVLTGCKLEPSIADVPEGTRMQFVRMGYYIQDSKPTEDGTLRFNRIVSLKDSFKPDKK